ncbi:MAG: efflux RND transporter permease subunit [Thermodesulfobacteriota bacterium]
MDTVRFSIKNPVTIIVGVIFVALFGLIGLFSMPYQLSPNVSTPEIAVSTTWPGATPFEVERDIIEEQEKVLKGIPGLVSMESTSFDNIGTITLSFTIMTDVDEALLRVSNKLNEVRSYPENVDRPIINATGTETSPVIWNILKPLPGNNRSIYFYRTFFENDVRARLERIEGVADLMVAGGREKEMNIIVSPARLASHGITITELSAILASNNVNISAGTMGLGRRDFRIRTVGETRTPEELGRLVIRNTGQESTLLNEIATVSYGYEKANVAMFQNSDEGIAVGIKPAPNANILELTDRVEVVIKDLNNGLLKDNNLSFIWVYDQRPYINGAIGLVRKNMLIGGVLAIITLLVFLGSFSSTLVVAFAIPISVIGTFLFMSLLGRNLNVVSLAGISFAVGMLVDNSIVVLENIDRHMHMGKSAFKAAYEGTIEVWGAVFASTMTTVAVFLPVIFMAEEAGQLFRDIALAITFSVAISLIVSVTVIPMLSNKLLSFAAARDNGPGGKKPGGKLNFLGARLSGFYMAVVALVIRNTLTRIITIIIVLILAGGSVYSLMPKMEYLPQGNRNLLMNILIPPPGISYEEKRDIWTDNLFKTIEPHLHKESGGLPAIKHTFYLGSAQFTLFGAISETPSRIRELMPLFREAIFNIPGFFGISTQASIFQSSLGKGRTIDIDFSGPDINRLVMAAGTMYGIVKKEVPDVQIRPVPSLEILYPEVRIKPERKKLRAAGMSVRDLGIITDVFMDGRKIGDFKAEGSKKIDLVLKTSEEDITTPEELYSALVTTPSGMVVPLSSLATLERTNGITQIRHLERQRTISLQVTPPRYLPLESVMDKVQNKLIPGVRKAGMLKGINVRLSGAADKLTEMRKALQWNFLLAALITYLLMSALFGNFIYPLIVMFTVPLAAAGGFIGLKLVNIFIAPSPLDILTMLGFIILIGVVVNNAILIVHQSLNFIRFEGMEHKEAVLAATRTRLRPIYMSAFTSLLGMLPLVVAPGPGSELYRGLGSVVLGGLAVSTVFTVLVIPALLMFVIRMEKPGKAAEK